MQRGEQTTAGHSSLCRDRSLKLLGDHPDFKHEVESAELRLQESLAREVERTVNLDTPIPIPSNPPGEAVVRDDGDDVAERVGEEDQNQQHDCRNPGESATNVEDDGRVPWRRGEFE